MERGEMRPQLPLQVERAHIVYSTFYDMMERYRLEREQARSIGFHEEERVVEKYASMANQRLRNIKNALDRAYGELMPERIVLQKPTADLQKGVYLLPNESMRIIAAPAMKTSVVRRWKPDLSRAEDVEQGEYLGWARIAPQRMLRHLRHADARHVVFGQ